MGQKRFGGRLAILGGSVAGFLSANVLYEYFDEIVLVDKDTLPLDEVNAHRRYVPQSYQTHILLAGGLKAIEEIIPGFRSTVIRHGAVESDAARNMRSLFSQGWLPVFDSGISIVAMSRSLLEGVIRQLSLQRLSKLQVRTNTQVKAIKLNTDAQHIVTLSDDTGARDEAFDFVVDARGRHSDMPSVLHQLGIQIRHHRMQPDIGYSTAWLRDVPLPRETNGLIELVKDPEHPIGGVVFNIEHGQSLLTLFGYNKHYPPREWSEILSCTRGFRSSRIYNVIKDCRPERVETFRKAETGINLFAKTGAWPEGLLVVGDAVSSFNPVYGQGIATCAISLTKAKQALLEGKDNIAAQKTITRVYEQAWMVSGNEDLRWPATIASSKPFGIKAVHKISDMIVRAASRNQDVALAYLKVLHMLEPPETLFRPDLLLKIFRHQYSGKKHAVSVD